LERGREGNPKLVSFSLVFSKARDRFLSQIFRLAKLREHRQLSTLFFHGPSISFVCLDGAERAFTKIFSARPPASAAAPNRRAIRQKHPGARFEKLL
jgi:hypothetical protein